MDVEYGFSCMGYELAGAWGAAMALPDGVVTTLLGDGSYLMLNSELFSAAFAGHPLRRGRLRQRRLRGDRTACRRGQGGAGFNNLYADCRTSHAEPPRVDFAGHAAAMGCAVFAVDSLADLYGAYRKAREVAVAERRPGGRGDPDASVVLDRGRGVVGGRRARNVASVRDRPGPRRGAGGQGSPGALPELSVTAQ